MNRGHSWRWRRGQGERDRTELIEGMCECPICGHRMSRQAAVPCSSIPCPRCGTPMAE